MFTIFSKKSVTFNHPKDYSISHTVKHLMFENVPDWVRDSSMFEALMSEGSVRVIDSAADLKAAEMSDTAKAEVFTTPVGETPDVEDDEETPAPEGTDYASMKATELYKICKERGLEVEAKQSKDFYLETLLEADRTE